MPVTLNRRMFLRGLGGFTLAVPFMSSIVPKEAAAQATDAPRRFVAIKSYSTQNIIDWYPTFSGGSYQLKDNLYGGSKADGTTFLPEFIPNTRYGIAPLSDFADGGVSRTLTANVNPWLDRLNLLRGVDYLPDTNHNDGGMLGNYAGCDDGGAARDLPHIPTIDQVLAYSSRFYPQTPAVRSLHLAPGGQNSISFGNYGIANGPVEQIQAHLDPRNAFNEVFNNFMPPDGGEPEIDPNALLVDRVYNDYDRTRNLARLSANDRELLERHMNLLFELQQSLDTGGGPVTAACNPPGQPRSISNNPPYADLGNVMDIRDTYRLMMDIAAAAIMCDQTRIVTLDVRKALSTGRGSEAGYFHGADSPGSWHGDAHAWGDPVADANLLELNRWITDFIFVGMLERLDVPDTDGRTILDNSLVFWGNELGFNHLNYSVPALLAGSAGGFLNTGNYIDYIDWDGRAYFAQNNGNVIKGIPHNRLLVTILQAMGLQPSDYERDGVAGYGSTSTMGKQASTHAIDYDFNQIGNPLPGLV